MLDLDIDTSDLDAKLARLDMHGMTQAVAVGVGESTRDLIAPYPAPARKRQPFKSAKARKYFFMALRTGKIEVPYRRSGDLGRSWIIAPTGEGADLTNTRPYADLVHGTKEQAGYHRGTWMTVDSAARTMEQSGEAEKVATDVVAAHLEKAGLT